MSGENGIQRMLPSKHLFHGIWIRIVESPYHGGLVDGDE
jgi:hypothetical protein